METDKDAERGSGPVASLNECVQDGRASYGYDRRGRRNRADDLDPRIAATVVHATLNWPPDATPALMSAGSRGSTSSSVPPLSDVWQTRPLKVMFALTSMPIGGTESLVRDLVSRMDPMRFAPLVCCLKELGPVGEQLAERYPTTSRILAHRFDVRVLPRLVRRMKGNIDALVTVGGGEKMFWGGIAARCAQVPVVLSALHFGSERIELSSRLLTRWTDAYVTATQDHGKHLVERACLPLQKVRVIPVGVDLERYRFDATAPAALRRELQIPADTPLCGMVAALRPEKNHELFLSMAQRVAAGVPDAHFVIVGDGPRSYRLKEIAARHDLSDRVHFLGNRMDVPRILAALNVFAFTARDAANPLAVLEALSAQVPVVATRVGAVPAFVKDGVTGFLVQPDDVDHLSRRVVQLMRDATLAKSLSDAGRQEVAANWSLDRMVRAYEQLIIEIYQRKQSGPKPERVGDSVEFCGATP